MENVGNMKRRLLFVCTANRQRSPTGEALFEGSPHFEARSCGAHPMAEVPADAALIEWADLIVCMEEEHRAALLDRFPSAREKAFRVLDIPDVYERDDPHLVMVLRTKLKDLLEGED